MFRTLVAAGLPLTLALALLSSAQTTAAAERVALADDDLPQLTAGNNAFALDLYGRVAAEGGNRVVSPWSISTALAMTYLGARGDTASEMRATLQYRVPDQRLHAAFGEHLRAVTATEEDAPYRLRVANALWAQPAYRFAPAYVGSIQEHYGATAQNLDFAADPDAARKRINAWVADRTAGKIQELLPPELLTLLTRLVLTNAVTFRAQWAQPFDARWTKDEPFHRADGTDVAAPLMHKKSAFRYLKRDGFAAVELGYRGNQVSMVVVLPDAVDGLPALERRLTPESFADWTEHLGVQQVDVHLPKFRIETGLALRDTLTAMGMPTAFGDDADFSGMDGTQSLFIQAVQHKAFIEVDERGTEAAAATAVVMALKGKAPRAVPFRADHPFLFVLRDRESGAILFMGRVTDPSIR